MLKSLFKKAARATFVLPAVVVAVVVIAAVVYLHGHAPAVFTAEGPVAEKERGLIYFALGLSVVVVLPVFAMLFGFAWKYRASNTKAKYAPEVGGSRTAEIIWWVIPGMLILILSVVAWTSSHDLDPYKSLASSKKQLTVQVVALDWRWLFIYPEQHVASLNYAQLPVGTPVDFEITADAPMNSFWIPQLGGQVYAMPGMSTHLHLMASKAGSYRGSSANISGSGFAGMTFTANAGSQANFDQWIQSAQHSPKQLDLKAYNALAKPDKDAGTAFYSSVENDLYDTIVMKYMMPSGTEGTK